MTNFLAILGVVLCSSAIWWLWREGSKEILQLRIMSQYNRLERTMTNRYILTDSGPHYTEAIEYLEVEIREFIRCLNFDVQYPKVTHMCILRIDEKSGETLKALREKLKQVEDNK